MAAVTIGAGQLSPVSAVEEIRIEVPIFEGGAGLDFFFLAAREYEKERPDVTVDLYGDPRIRDKVRMLRTRKATDCRTQMSVPTKSRINPGQ